MNQNNNKKNILIEVDLTDLIYIRRAMDSAFAELEAAVADGDVKESVIIELDEAMNIVGEYIK